MAFKKELYRECPKCGEPQFTERPEGLVSRRCRCARDVPGPPNPPKLFKRDEDVIVEPIFGKAGADRLAYCCAVAVARGDLDSRSEIGDTLLDYLDIPNSDHKDVPSWMRSYERRGQKP